MKSGFLQCTFIQSNSLQGFLQWLFLCFILKFKPQHGTQPTLPDLAVIHLQPPETGAFQSLPRQASLSTLSHATPPSCCKPSSLSSVRHGPLHASVSLITPSITWHGATHTPVAPLDLGQDSHDELDFA